MARPRILFVDAYDSFSNNIVSLLTTVLDVHVDIIPIDSPALVGGGGPHYLPNFRQQELRRVLAGYHAVVCGPGPGSPVQDKDVGLMKHIWELQDADLVPVLGICLGFQSLAVSCGATIKRLSTGLHGMIRNIDHSGHHGDGAAAICSNRKEEEEEEGGNIFHDVAPFKATLYHSLHADIGQSSVPDDQWEAWKWEVPAAYPDIVPQAWVYEDRGGGGGAVERILMAMKHRTRPFWGLQYHPESICTEAAGHRVIQNWFDEAIRWNQGRGRCVTEVAPILDGITQLPHPLGKSGGNELASNAGLCSWTNSDSPLASFGVNSKYHSRRMALPRYVEVADLVEILQSGKKDYIVLDSASAHAKRIGSDVRGRYSIIALDVDEALQLEYRTGNGYLTARQECPLKSQSDSSPINERIDLAPGQAPWKFLSDFWERRRMEDIKNQTGTTTETSSPCFRGGFIGYITYEMGLEGIDVKSSSPRNHDRPDLCFAWVTKSIVLDHLEGTIYIQSLSQPDDDRLFSAAESWLDQVAYKLTTWPMWTEGDRHYDLHGDSNSEYRGDFDQNRGRQSSEQHQQLTPPLTPTSDVPVKKSSNGNTNTVTIQTPVAEEYEDKVRQCQDLIAAGHSYELCLTDQTYITKSKSPYESRGALSSSVHLESLDYRAHECEDNDDDNSDDDRRSSWTLYRTLRTKQPAPFGSYLRLGGATLISSSPERFLEYSADGLCSMRPMKGTVRKTPSSSSTPSSTTTTVAAKTTATATAPSTTAATLEEANKILHVPKEEAENLMIVDLVRHDLHGVCGPGAGAVSVPRLLVVEEYASVFSMVSVVEGKIPPLPAAPAPLPTATSTSGQEEQGRGGGVETRRRKTGLDVLAASLPPGSMTGAPKKRSCELLGDIERHRRGRQQQDGPSDTASAAASGNDANADDADAGVAIERSLYSGVVGYMDVTGRGDWSVTIRSLFRWDDEDHCSPQDEEEGSEKTADSSSKENKKKEKNKREVWHIGAGGAVTALSTPEGESDEMFTKLKGPLGIFRG